jgi:hypothetical protein
MNIPIFNLQNANMDTLVQGSFTRMNSLLQMKKHRRSIDVHELRLRNMHDFFSHGTRSGLMHQALTTRRRKSTLARV